MRRKLQRRAHRANSGASRASYSQELAAGREVVIVRAGLSWALCLFVPVGLHRLEADDAVADRGYVEDT